MNKETITFLGVGDVLIDRQEPATIFKHAAVSESEHLNTGFGWDGDEVLIEAKK